MVSHHCDLCDAPYGGKKCQKSFASFLPPELICIVNSLVPMICVFDEGFSLNLKAFLHTFFVVSVFNNC